MAAGSVAQKDVSRRRCLFSRIASQRWVMHSDPAMHIDVMMPGSRKSASIAQSIRQIFPSASQLRDGDARLRLQP